MYELQLYDLVWRWDVSYELFLQMQQLCLATWYDEFKVNQVPIPLQL